MSDTPEAPKTEKWSALEQWLPIVVGLLFIAAGAFIFVISVFDIVTINESLIGYIIWSVALIIFGLAILYIRFAIMPSVRKLK